MAANNYSQAVDKLTMMFPTVERPTIENILVNECKGDTTKSIVILTKVQQFNQSMKTPNNNHTSNAGETIQPTAAVPIQQPQSIPLQVIIPQSINSNNSQQADCCGPDSCACCLMKPASYKNGLYRIDYTMYNISFLIFSGMTLYPDCTLQSLELSYHGLYLPLVGLILIAIVAIFHIFIGGTDADVGRGNKYGTFRGCLYIFGGLFYFLGYMIHAATVDKYYNTHGYNDWYNDFEYIYPQPAYLVGRGLFVGIHAMFIGYLYVTNNRLPRFLGARLPLIRFWTLLFIVYYVLVLCFLLPVWSLFYFIVYTALSPLVLIITLFLNFCVLHKSNESGGCNSGVSLGLLIVISYYFQLLVFALIIIASRFDNYYYEEEQAGWYIFWDFAMFIFGSIQLWIMSRAMHPVNANCGCTHHGLGDGNVSSARYPSTAPESVAMVVQPQQTAAPAATR